MKYLVKKTEYLYGAKGYADEGETVIFISSDPKYGLVKEGDEFKQDLDWFHGTTRRELEGKPSETKEEYAEEYLDGVTDPDEIEEMYREYVDEHMDDCAYLVRKGERIQGYDGYSNDTYCYNVKEITDERAAEVEQIIKAYKAL